LRKRISLGCGAGQRGQSSAVEPAGLTSYDDDGMLEAAVLGRREMVVLRQVLRSAGRPAVAPLRGA
jgi:hypothetical protein